MLKVIWSLKSSSTRLDGYSFKDKYATLSFSISYFRKDSRAIDVTAQFAADGVSGK